MNQIKKNIKKYFFEDKTVIRIVYFTFFLCIIGFFKDCGRSSDMGTVITNQEILINKLDDLDGDFDSLLKVMPNTKVLFQLQLLEFEKNGLKTIRDILYNESAIDNKKLDSDKIMSEYNVKIEEIDKKIKELYENR